MPEKSHDRLSAGWSPWRAGEWLSLSPETSETEKPVLQLSVQAKRPNISSHGVSPRVERPWETGLPSILVHQASGLLDYGLPHQGGYSHIFYSDSDIHLRWSHLTDTHDISLGRVLITFYLTGCNSHAYSWKSLPHDPAFYLPSSFSFCGNCDFQDLASRISTFGIVIFQDCDFSGFWTLGMLTFWDSNIWNHVFCRVRTAALLQCFLTTCTVCLSCHVSSWHVWPLYI